MDVLIQETLSLLYMGSYSDWYMYIVHVYNSNRTKRSPIQAVIIQVINKIGWLHCEGIHCTFSLKKNNSSMGKMWDNSMHMWHLLSTYTGIVC